MSNNKQHTLETLEKISISESGHELFDICIVEPDGGSVCHFTRWDNAPEKAQRIVQCVNEFAGIPNVEGWMEKQHYLLTNIKHHISNSQFKVDKYIVDMLDEALALFPQTKEPSDEI